MAIRRRAAALQDCQPINTLVGRRQLRRRQTRTHRRAVRTRHPVLGHRARTLPRLVCHALPAAAHQRRVAQGASPRLLLVRRHPQQCERVVEVHHRLVWQRLQDLLLPFALPLRVAGMHHFPTQVS